MANAYCQLYVQAVFAVKYRDAVLAKEWRKDVFAVMGKLINETGCECIIVNGVEDHVHLFFNLSKNPFLVNGISHIFAVCINVNIVFGRFQFLQSDNYGKQFHSVICREAEAF